MKPTYLIIVFLLFISLPINAQLSEAETAKIDSLFLNWTKDNSPGGAIGIMQNNKVVYSKAFGLASLEYKVPNTTETIFNTGSVSKQFTAMGIVLLHQKGLLNVNDDIRKHLPDLPDFGHVITIKHMLHHTSGMRSLHAMLNLAGWRGDDSRTNADLYRFMLKQKELNFKPGDEYLYCNTGYMLMVNIIEKITNEKFPEWMKANIFEPLGMENTYVEDLYSRIVPNNATSYRQRANDMIRAVEYWGYVGSGNMHSTTSDLLIWLNHFDKPNSTWSAAFKIMQMVTKLNDGSENPYAFGVGINEINGYKKIQHGGAIGGFRSYVSTYPEKELSIAILTNFSSSNPGGKESQIANILLDKKEVSETEKSKKMVEKSAIKVAVKNLYQFEASYWNDKENSSRKIYVKNDTLRYSRSNNDESPLVPISSNEFKMIGPPNYLVVKFNLTKNGLKTMQVSVDNGPFSYAEAYGILTNTTKNMTDYVGRFYSPELESTYDILIKNERLIAHHARHGDLPIKILKKDVLEIPQTAIIKYERKDDQTVNGIRISNGRARNVWFKKQ